MRLLLLGCTGFVGKELVPTLLKENHEIYIVSRKPISKLKVDLDFNKLKFLLRIFFKLIYFQPNIWNRPAPSNLSIFVFD